VTRELNLLSSVFSAAIHEWRWIKSNPISEVIRPLATPHRERIITRSETRRMLRALDYRPLGAVSGERQIVGAVFVFALRTGMRSSEITGLRWRNVHDSWVTLPETKNGTRRDVPLSRPARRLVQRMRGADPDYVFPVSDGSRDAIFRAARERAGLGGFHFHDARHCFATRIGATVGQPGRLSFPEFCKVMGWKDPRMALTYTNPRAEDLAQKL
jgi:integrase